MLEKLVIKRLLDQFDYELDLSSGPADRIRFLSGPNGYGKTCILRIIDSLYHNDYDKLFLLPFLSLELWVDGAYLSVEKDMIDVETDESSDKESEKEVASIRFTYRSGGITKEFSLNSGEKMLEFDAPFAVHLRSLPCYFISNKLLLLTDGVEEELSDGSFTLGSETVATSVTECATRMANKIQERLITLPNMTIETEGETISEEEYNNRVLALNDTILRLKKNGLITNTNVNSYKLEFAPYLRSYLERIETVVKKGENFLNRVELFHSIITELEFTNKELLIDSFSGFLFRLTKPTVRFIENEKLSSGEQHIIIQLYNMLFCNADDYMLTLIDEPELSLHPAWIVLYYKHLAKIVELRNMQCVLATHSADIFNMQWKKCIDLYELVNE